MNTTLFYIIFFFLLHQFNSFEKKHIENKKCEVKKDILRHINCYYEVELLFFLIDYFQCLLKIYQSKMVFI